MSAPTNTTAATATVISTLPYSTTQRVDDSGTTYTVWYQYTAAPTDTLLSIFGFGDLSVYKPETRTFNGSLPTPTPYLVIGGAVNVPVQIPVSGGQTYWFKFIPNAGNPTPANLSVSVESLALMDVLLGSLFINDDTSDFAGIIISAVNGDNHHVLKAVQPFPASESMDVMADGTIASINEATGQLDIFAADFTLQHSVTIPGVPLGSAQLVRLGGTSNFYVGYFQGSNAKTTVISSAGVLGTTYTMASIGVTGIAVAPNESVFYYTGGGAIKRWDLVNNVALSDLAAAVGGVTTSRLLTLADGSVIALYLTTPMTAKRYSSAGSLLHTYTFSGSTTTDPRICSSASPPLSFWVRVQLTGDSTAEFIHVLASDGSVLATVDAINYEDGIYQGAATATPISRFGPSESCDVIELRSGVAPGPVILPLGDPVELPIRRVRRSPHLSDEQFRIFYKRIQFDVQPGNGNLVDPGLQPQLMVRYSNDGGYTWSNEIPLSSGQQGDYTRRVYALMLGSGRDRVWELSSTDPVFTVWLQALIDIEKGLS